MAYCDYKNDKKFDKLRSHVRKKRVTSIVMYVFTLGAALLFGYIWGKTTNYGSPALAMLLCGLLSLFALGPLGVLRIFTDRYVEGEIVQIRAFSENTSKHLHKQMIDGSVTDTVFEIYVLTPNGDTKLFKDKCRGIPNDHYKVGDKVRHYPGLYLFEKEEKKQGDTLICSACGNYIDSDMDDCPICGLPLLK